MSVIDSTRVVYTVLARMDRCGTGSGSVFYFTSKVKFFENFTLVHEKILQEGKNFCKRVKYLCTRVKYFTQKSKIVTLVKKQ